jgi:hypothetical protein
VLRVGRDEVVYCRVEHVERRVVSLRTVDVIWKSEFEDEEDR